MATIITKNSSTAGAAPTSSDLVQGELAVNVTDKALYTENASGTVVKLNAPSIVDNGNATAITIDSSENVGIGTNNPSSYGGKLAVIGGTTRTSVFAVGGGDYGTGRGYIYLNGGGYDQSVIYDAWAGSATTPEQAAGKHVFHTGGVERARIDSSGNLLVGTTTASLSNSYSVGILTAAGQIFSNKASGSASGSVYQYYAYGGASIGGVSQSGTTAVIYSTTSDYRLKENVQPLVGALSRIAALKPCTYTWKSAPDELGEGFIAHELQAVCPQAVTGEKDAVDADGKPVYQGIDTSFLVATLTAAIQELKATVDAQAARITALEQAA